MRSVSQRFALIPTMLKGVFAILHHNTKIYVTKVVFLSLSGKALSVVSSEVVSGWVGGVSLGLAPGIIA